MSALEGRTRKRRAARKQARAAELWADEEKWKKYVRCTLCRKRCCVNNYADRKVRIPSRNKIAKRFVCAWCLGRDGKFLMQLLLIAEKVAAGDGPILCSREEDCKCLRCVASRILQAHSESPSVK